MSVTFSFSHLYPKTFLTNLPAQNPGGHNFLMSLVSVYIKCVPLFPSSMVLEDTIITAPSKPVCIRKILDP